MLRARELMRKGARVDVLPLEAIGDDDYIGSVGGIGAPVVGIEKIKQGQECLRALRGVEDAAGVRVSALISAEIGGSNSIEPVLTAAYAGLPVVDGDGMGRAFPEVQMSTFFIYGLDPSPGAIADDKGNVVVFKSVVDMYWLERFARHIAVDMGAGAGFATAPMLGAYVKKVAVPGTLTQALEVGRTILAARARRQSVIDRLIETTGASLFFTGKVADVRRELRGGFAVGEARLTGLGDHARVRGADRDPERESHSLRRWPAGRHGSRPDHEPRARDRRAGHHRDAALRPAARDRRAAGAQAHEDAGSLEGRRPEGLRLYRSRLRSAASLECRRHREGGAMTDLKLIRTIDVADLDDIATGGAILGTGGGGDPYIGKLMAQEAIRRHGPVSLVDVDGFAADALIAPVCMMGAPTVMTEKLPQGEEIVIALRKLEKFMGRQVDGLLCGEAGGINSTTPFVAAAATGLPLIDGDGMGRAFPELQMTTFGMHGVSATPMVLGDDKGNSVVLETINNRWTERLARSATVDMGGSALLAFYPMTGALAKRAIVRGTLTLCADLGRKLREARARHDDPIEAVRAALEAEIIFNGRVKDVLRRTVGGFARGEAEIEGLDEHRGHKLRIAFQNEFLIAEIDGKTVVTTPDMITLLDAETGAPVTADGMRYGIRVVALAYPCAGQWRTPKGLELVGPRYFGYDLDFQPFTPGAAR